MSWRDRLLPGSYRGAAFFIQESRATFGRRNKLHGYPGRDTPWAEDLGRAADRWTVECLVIGDDYDQARDALVKALRAKGAATLVHPFLGSMQAQVDTSEVAESTAEGGVARFSIQFMEPGADTTPAATTDTQAASIAASANVATAAATSASTRISVASQPGFVVLSAESLLGQARGVIASALSAVQPVAGLIFGTEQQLAGLVSGAIGLLTLPVTFAATIFAAIGAVGDQATYADDALTQLIGPTGDAPQPNGLIGFGDDLPAIAPSTPSLTAQANNQAAICQLIQAAAAASAVSVVAQMDFTSYDDAASIRDALADQLDTLATAIADAGDDVLADSIDDLRLAMIRDVTARGASLARLYAYTPAMVEPALVIAQRLYGDGTRADEIIARNAIAHPLFVPAAPLEVLSNA